MELLVAVILPIAVFVTLLSRHPARRAAHGFAGLVFLYAAPYVLMQGTPVSLDFLLREPPWQYMGGPGYLQKNGLINDVPLQMLPWQEAVRSQWRNRSLPVLDRAIGSGSPLWVNLQAAVAFPTVLFSIALSTFAWPLASLVTKLLLALWGMYLLLERRGLSPPSRVFGAIAYAFCTFTIAFAGFPHTNVTTLLPLFLTTLHSVPEGWRGTARATLVLTLMLLGGHPESVLHSALIALPYAGLLVTGAAPSRRLAVSVRFGAIGTVALLLAAPVLMPFLGYLPHTQRLHEVQANRDILAPPPGTAANLMPFVMPNYFGNPRVHNYRSDFNFNELCTQYAGLAALILAIGAAVAAPRQHRFWIVMFGLITLLVFEPPFIASIVRYVPLLDMSPNGRLRFALAMITAIVGAHGFELLMRGENRRTLAATAFVLAATVAVISVASYPTFAQYGTRRLIFFSAIAPLGSAAAILLASRRPRMAFAIPVLLFMDLIGVMPMYNPAVGRELYYPRTPAIEAIHRQDDSSGPHRVTGIGRALPPITSRFAGVEDIRVHDPSAFRPYVAVLDAAGFDRSHYFGQFRALPPQPVLDFLGVRWIIAPPGMAVGALPLVNAGADADVYRNESALPRYFIPDRIERSADPVASLVMGRIRGCVYSETLTAQPAPAEVRIERYDSNGSTIVVRAERDTFVASSEVALPGHALKRNGEPWPTEIINGAFVGWHVRAGTSRFELSYRPPMFAMSIVLCAVGLIITSAMFVVGRRQATASRIDRLTPTQ